MTHEGIINFEKKFTKSDGCWIWKGAVDKNGYGKFAVPNVGTASSHRVSYAIYNGELPPEMAVLHNCDNPSCVNPEHLFLGTQLENVKDKVNKGRQARGDRNGSSKLSEAEILIIITKIRSGVSINRLSEEYKISKSQLYKIKNGKKWKHLVQ